MGLSISIGPQHLRYQREELDESQSIKVRLKFLYFRLSSSPILQITLLFMATITEDISLSADLMDLYNLYYTPSMTNVTLHQGDKNSPVIYCGISKLIRTKPMFYLHKKSESGPIVSFCQVPWASKTMSIGLGNGAAIKEWQEMTRDRSLCQKKATTISNMIRLSMIGARR